MGLPAKLLSLFTRQPRKHRTPDEQHKVDQATQKLSLYQFAACPYCIRVRRVIRKLQLDIELRDAAGNPAFQQELRMYGGKLQTPCLRIEQEDQAMVWLYESSAIIHYLKTHFSIT
jgi:glutaredoxin